MTGKASKAMAARLKQIRLEQRLTQQELAQKAGISVNYYAMIERGENSPSFDVLEKLVRALKIDSKDILPF